MVHCSEKVLLVLRRLHFLRETALEVLLDLAVVFPEVVVHGRVDLLLCGIEMPAGHDGRSLAEGEHAGFPAEGFEIGSHEAFGFPGKVCRKIVADRVNKGELSLGHVLDEAPPPDVRDLLSHAPESLGAGCFSICYRDG
jgi:hypothetical protein